MGKACGGSPALWDYEFSSFAGAMASNHSRRGFWRRKKGRNKPQRDERTMDLQQQHEPLDLAIDSGKKREQLQYGSYDKRFRPSSWEMRTEEKAKPTEAEQVLVKEEMEDPACWFSADCDSTASNEDPEDWLPAGKRWRFKVPHVEAYLKTLPFKKRICLMMKMAKDDYP